MAEARYFCPDCGSIDIILAGVDLVGPSGGSAGAATCPNCDWTGPISQAIGALSSERFWDVERVGSLLLRVVQKHAAGPMVQALEFVGLLPKPKTSDDADFRGLDSAEVSRKLELHNAIVQECRDLVMRDVFAAAITAGFAAAEHANRYYAAATATPIHPMLES